jgi:hypothetical protein
MFLVLPVNRLIPTVSFYVMTNVLQIMLFMAIVSTGSAESIAVSSLVAYDVYRQYFNKEATGDQILKVSRIVIVVFGLFSGAFAIVLQTIGLSLGWVYLFMGIIIGSAVAPLWNMMTWSKASGTGAIVAAWSGLTLALIAWLVGASIQGGSISVANLGTNEVMLSGNLVAIFSSAFIHYVYSKFIDPHDYDFAELDEHIDLVEEDTSGLTAAEKDPVELEAAYIWITRRGYVLSFLLIILWPLLSVPAGVFSRGYFAFWVLIAIAWGFGAALAITIIPLVESKDEIYGILNGIWTKVTGKEIESAEEIAKHEFEDESDETPLKEIDEEAPAVPETSISASKAVAVEVEDEEEIHA